MLFRGRPSILVARSPALAEPRTVACVVGSLVSVPRYVTVRCAFGISYVLWSRSLPGLPVRAPALRYFPSRRPRVCGCSDVGLGNVCLSGPGGDCHNPDALATRAWLEGRGRLNMSSDSRIAAFEVTAVAQQ